MILLSALKQSLAAIIVNSLLTIVALFFSLSTVVVMSGRPTCLVYILCCVVIVLFALVLCAVSLDCYVTHSCPEETAFLPMSICINAIKTCPDSI